MMLNNQRRRIIANDCIKIRLMEQDRHDFKLTGQENEVIRIEEKLLVAYWFMLGQLEMLINDRDEPK